MNWYLAVLKNYAGFSGRARRKEFWMFVLVNFLITMIVAVLDNVLGTTFGGIGYGYIYVLYNLFIIIPSIAVTVRRLHDVGKSGWFYFIVLIPLVGAIWLFVLLCTDSNYGDNQYGSNPKNLDSYHTDFA